MNLKQLYNKETLKGVTDYKNPTCKGCTECCTIFTPITEEELIRLVYRGNTMKKFIENNYETDLDRDIVDATCPFADKKTKRCVVYDIRPSICRSFHCSAELNKIPNILVEYKYFMYNVFGVDTDTIKFFEGLRAEMQGRGLM